MRTLSDSDYAKYFGFTDAEVREMLRYYGIEETFARIKEWYDGYHIGHYDIYCPWDVINQCDKFRMSEDAPMEAHWENSSGNGIVRAEGSWVVRSNAESGVGYTDIQIEVPSERIGCVIEVKYAENGRFDAACKNAENRLINVVIQNRFKKRG